MSWCKLPPVSGFTLFYKVALTRPEIMCLSPPLKGPAIMELWGSLEPGERKYYIDRAQIENSVKKELIASEAIHVTTTVPHSRVSTVYPGDKCCICHENEPTTLYHPCGHIAFCKTCLGDMMPTTCAICRAQVASIIDISKFRSQ